MKKRFEKEGFTRSEVVMVTCEAVVSSFDISESDSDDLLILLIFFIATMLLKISSSFQ